MQAPNESRVGKIVTDGVELCQGIAKPVIIIDNNG